MAELAEIIEPGPCLEHDGGIRWRQLDLQRGSEDLAPDLPARQITGAQSGREGLAISSGKRALQPPP